MVLPSRFLLGRTQGILAKLFVNYRVIKKRLITPKNVFYVLGFTWTHFLHNIGIFNSYHIVLVASVYLDGTFLVIRLCLQARLIHASWSCGASNVENGWGLHSGNKRDSHVEYVGVTTCWYPLRRCPDESRNTTHGINMTNVRDVWCPLPCILPKEPMPPRGDVGCYRQATFWRQILPIGITSLWDVSLGTNVC